MLRLDSRNWLKLALSSIVELKELPKEDVEAKLCCFLIPNEEVVRKSSSLAKVLLIE
jgi:hypothetical protein